MSGQPYKYESDPAKFRTAYMDQLNLRAKLDDENYQVNKIYKATGNLSARSVPDTRSTSEILADTERLKISLIATLKPVANPQMASIVVQGVNGSKLNADGSFFIWFYQNSDEIVKQLSKQYKVGIKGDMNDATTMVSHLEDMYSKIKDMNSSVSAYYTNPTTSGIKQGDITKLFSAYQDLTLKLLSRTTGVNATQASQRIKNIVKDTVVIIDLLKDILDPAVDTFIKMAIASATTAMNPQVYSNALQNRNTIYDLLKDYESIIESLPSSQKINTLVTQFTKSLVNTDESISEQIATSILELLPTRDKLINFDRLFQSINNQVIGIAGQPSTFTTATGTVTPASQPTGAISGTARLLGETISDIIIAGGVLDRTTIQAAGTPYGDAIRDGAYRANADAQGVTLAVRRQVIDNAIRSAEGLVASAAPSLPTQRDIMQNVSNVVTSQLKSLGATGSGLRRGRPKGSGIAFKDKIDHDKGIKPSKHYIPFGRYFVNHHKLHDDVLAIKSMSGTNVREFPSSRISKKLSKVIRTIVGGGNPSFNDMNELTNEEKDYLFKVSKRAQISDKLSIPTPSKDAQDKDMNSFEVMKGEIMSGNDSHELIKKFKILLLRLSKSGVLPKREVGEIMQELIELGY